MSAPITGVMCEKISKSAVEGIEATVLRTVERKPCGPSDLRIRVKAASINFPELLMMQNKYQYKPKLPFVLCTEGSGVVSEVGSDVKSYKVGDKVCFATMSGCAVEEVVLDAKTCFPMPNGLSFSQGAGFHMGYTTGYHALVHRGKLQPGEWLLVTGAGGGMGLMAVELGKALGAKVIAAASSDDKLEACKKVGADYVVNYSKEDMKEAVGKITNGAFCDVIYDPVGGKIFDQCVRCVAVRGYARLLVIGFASGTIPKFPVNMALIKGFDLVGVRMGGQMAFQPELADEMLQELLKLANQGKLKPYVCAEYPMEKYKEAFTLMEQKKVVGKCCITFNNDAQSKL